MRSFQLNSGRSARHEKKFVKRAASGTSDAEHFLSFRRRSSTDFTQMSLNAIESIEPVRSKDLSGEKDWRNSKRQSRLSSELTSFAIGHHSSCSGLKVAKFGVHLGERRASLLKGS